MPAYLFKSSRLGFRPWEERDIPLMADISSDPQVMKYFPETATRSQTQEFVHRMTEMFSKRGYCYFPVDLIKTGEMIGFIGLCYQEYDAPFTPCTDIGWRLAPDHWNNGYATEGAKRCLELGFGDLELNQILATAPLANQPSINVMNKLGMELYMEYKNPRLSEFPALEDCACYRIINSGLS